MNARWRATVFYRTDNGLVDVEYDLEELADIHNVIEAGPDWDTVVKVEIVRINHCDAADLTIEAAAEL